MARISLGSNTTSLQAQTELNKSTSALVKSYQRLSSGLRINDASDDAAGLAIVAQLNSKARVYSQAIRNVNDGVSAASIAEGALTALKSISQRQLELSEEAANGTYSTTQRQALNKEANSLVDEYNRIVSSTTFNGLNLFDPKLGSVLVQAGYGQSESLQLGLSNQLQRAVGDGTFQTAQTVQVNGSVPRNVTLGDINGDGKLDMVVANYSTNDISVLIGNGDGTFQAAKTFQAASVADTFTVTLGDVNGDGKLDIVATDYAAHDVSVFISNGDGTFQTATTFQTGGELPKSAVLGDLNGDGKLDIVTGDLYSHDLSILVGNGDGTFQAAKTIRAPGTQFQFVTLADINGDGKLDIAAADSSGKDVAIFLGNGDGTFQTSRTFKTGGNNPNSVAFGDFNGDGKIDIATSDYGSRDISILLGNGDGSFQAAKTIQTAGTFPFSVASGDFNGDGRLDLITADGAGNDVGVFLSNGDGTFQAAKSFQTGGVHPFSVALGDLNNDGRLDVVTADYSSNDVSIFTGNGGYTSTAPYVNINTQQGARDAFNTVTANLNRIEGQLGVIGATTSQFQTELANLETRTENFEAAASQIQDVDVASESANLTREQILQQAAASVLAQANQEPRIALTLLGE